MIRQSIRLVRLAFAPLLRRGNRWTRKAAWRQEAAFWHARERFERLRFRFLSVLLRRRRSLGEGATAVVVARGLARAIFFPALLAAAFVALLVWLDHYSLSFSLLDGFGDAGRATLLQPVLAAAERALGGWARALAFGQPVEQAHAALLVTGAQVTAAFLGFYFAAISVVAGTAYGNVPPDLRSVLIEDQVGNFYLHLVGFTGAACLFALGTLALGYSLGVVSAFAFAILGAASVLSFLPLGKRVFRFLDPEAVTASLAKDIRVAVSTVAGSGTLARNRSIQAHHQKVAASKLQAWEELVAVSASRFHSASALRVIGQNAAGLLLQYSRAKLTIVRTSLWFRPAYAHPSYLTAGYSQLVSFGAAGALQPTLEPDHLWMEKRLGDILRRVVTALLERGSEEACTEMLGAFQRWIDVSAEQLDAVQLEAGFSIASDLGGGSGWASLGTPEGTARDHLGRLALLDGIAGTIPAAVAALYRRLSTVSLDELVSDALQMTGRHSRSFAGLPPTVRSGVETFRDQHAFERDVEGSVGTPAWFVEHHVARFLSVDLGNTFTLLLSQSEQWLPSHAKLLRENREIEGAATVIRRGMESVRKLEAAAAKTQSALEYLQQRRVSAAGEEWPTYSYDDWTERLRSLRLALVDELVSLTPHLSSASPKGDVPDSFGFAYTTLAYESDCRPRKGRRRYLRADLRNASCHRSPGPRQSSIGTCREPRREHAVLVR